MPTMVTIRTGPGPSARVSAAGLNRGSGAVRTRTVSAVSAAPPNREAGYTSGRSPWLTVRASASGRENKIVVNRK